MEVGVLDAYVSAHHFMLSAQGGQERVSGPHEPELPCGCYKLNPGPLKEHPGLLITEPAL